MPGKVYGLQKPQVWERVNVGLDSHPWLPIIFLRETSDPLEVGQVVALSSMHMIMQRIDSTRL